MTGIAWTMPTPVGDTVPPSANLGNDPFMMNWERITDRLKTAFPQQTRYLSFYLIIKDHFVRFPGP
jgi:E3 ubiquitin-protein ligase DZIP3